MMGSYTLVLLAALIAGFGAFMIRKVFDYKGHPAAYLSIFYLITVVISVFMGPPLHDLHSLDWKMVGAGAVSGVVIVTMMAFLGKALSLGPSGISFAFQNSGSMVPPFLMAFLFQAPFGFSLSLFNIAGMALVVLGLFWSARLTGDQRISKKWALYAILSFFCQGLLLSLYQWRCFLTDLTLPIHALVPFKCSEIADTWFMPAMFLSAWFFQTLLFLVTQKRRYKPVELLFGALGGVSNTFTTLFLLQAAKVATGSTEKAMIFPLFAGLMILICSLSGRLFYKERVNWIVNALCVVGIVVGTLN